MSARIRLGISACLLGQEVRYDGQHKLDRFLVDTLGSFVDYVPVCPEVECGLPVPREAMRLVGTPDAPRLITQQTKRDLTGQMRDWIDCRLGELEKEGLCGFIFKSKSPSSGMERVKVYNDKGAVVASGAGLFAGAFMQRFPLLPVEDEGRLCDPELRENFIERIFVLERYRTTIDARAAMRDLMGFHAAHKYLIMAHNEPHMRKMGRMLSGGGRRDVEGLKTAYEKLLLEALQSLATPAKHTNVLQHMAGFFRDALPDDERDELQEVIRRYRAGLVPLIVPVTLIQHHVRKHKVSYLADQVYLNPAPAELRLRNHA